MNQIRHKYLTICFTFALVLIGLVACNSSTTYNKWTDIEGLQWSKDSAYHFVFEIQDTNADYNIDFGIRHLNQYPYQNIWLLTDLQKRDSTSFVDTIQYKIADEYGVWYGKHSAGLYSFNARMYSKVKFSSLGQYIITLNHGMREQTLLGVSAIGIKIEKNQ